MPCTHLTLILHSCHSSSHSSLIPTLPTQVSRHGGPNCRVQAVHRPEAGHVRHHPPTPLDPLNVPDSLPLSGTSKLYLLAPSEIWQALSLHQATRLTTSRVGTDVTAPVFVKRSQFSNSHTIVRPSSPASYSPSLKVPKVRIYTMSTPTSLINRAWLQADFGS